MLRVSLHYDTFSFHSKPVSWEAACKGKTCKEIQESYQDHEY
jgi:hypothetical protein